MGQLADGKVPSQQWPPTSRVLVFLSCPQAAGGRWVCPSFLLREMSGGRGDGGQQRSEPMVPPPGGAWCQLHPLERLISATCPQPLDQLQATLSPQGLTPEGAGSQAGLFAQP